MNHSNNRCKRYRDCCWGGLTCTWLQCREKTNDSAAMCETVNTITFRIINAEVSLNQMGCWTTGTACRANTLPKCSVGNGTHGTVSNHSVGAIVTIGYAMYNNTWDINETIVISEAQPVQVRASPINSNMDQECHPSLLTLGKLAKPDDSLSRQVSIDVHPKHAYIHM